MVKAETDGGGVYSLHIQSEIILLIYFWSAFAKEKQYTWRWLKPFWNMIAWKTLQQESF